MEDDDVGRALEVNARRRVVDEIPLAPRLRAAAEVQAVVDPQSIDRRRMRPAIGVDGAHPVMCRARHSVAHVRPRQQLLLSARYTIFAREIRSAYFRRRGLRHRSIYSPLG
jgi:hypothetical protein